MARRRKTILKAEAIKTELEHDPLRNFEGSPLERAATEFFYRMRANARPILMGLAGVVILVIFVVLFLVWKDAREDKAQAAFDDLMREATMKPGSGAEKAAVEKLNKYKDSYGGKYAANRADLYRLLLLTESKDYAAAAATASELAGRMPSPDLEAFFYLKAGAFLEQAEKYADAASAYGKAEALIPDSNAVKASARFGMGRVLILSGKAREGEEMIRKMMDMKEAENIEEMRIAATAFLLKTPKK